MIIIGVDPGTIITGFGIIKYENSKLNYLYSGIIKTPSTKEIPPRLESIYDELQRLISNYNPTQFAIETVFYNNNIQSILKIGYVRGIALLAAQKCKLEICEYSPREVKKSVVGNGAASKEQVQFMVKKLLNLQNDFPKFDESDALAIATCHAFKKDSLSHKSGSWKKFVEANPDKVL
ncbi:MAG: crossover junction endodeoxyribonuclease RuvC [Ignavibacteriales bacterium CG18_big_fil_WC_8_21_14_2_50_31_20]|nr:MAG: crossover junction endodeoxyribonuclease RuvC [Ignavibacteriales bacterium CG18_big_fil_WC_8_21_14_2_50_31_20]